MNPALENILSRLQKVKKVGNGWQACCPAHADRDPSLRVDEGRGGRVLLNCFAGCSPQEIVKAIGLEMTDLFPPRPQSIGSTDRNTYYNYKDASGELLFRVVRTPDKKFFQQRPDNNGGWVNGLGGIRPVLYRLPELSRALETGEAVFVPEGEKDVNNLIALGLTATCNPMGAGKWRPWYSDSLKGANAVLLPDNDEPGRQHTRQVARSLKGKAKSVKVLELPGLADKGDVSDWLANGGTKDELLELAAAAPEWLQGKAGEWPEPEPIEAALLPVDPLHSSIIPGPLREWALDVAHRMQCPVDFVAVGALVVASSLIGAGCGIRPKQRDDWLVTPNLWGGIVARPSMLKTPALSEAMKPLKRLEAQALEQHKNMLLSNEAEQEIFKAAREATKREMLAVARNKGKPGKTLDDLKYEYAAIEPPGEPTRRRYLTNDATIEKMAELLNENPRGMLYFRDELVGFLVTLDREDRQTDRAFYLESWNGYGSYTTDRIGRGTIDTNNLCVSILGGIQPSRLTGYLLQAKDSLQNDGLLQRFQLLVYPDEPANWQLVDEYPNKEARDRAFSVFSALADMDFTEHGAEQLDSEEQPYFRFSSEAQDIFNTWLTELQAKLQTEDSPLMVEHLSKYRSLMPSLALVFHLIGVANGQANGPVSTEAALAGIAWCDYLEGHARRIYGMVGDIGQRAAGELAKRIKEKKLQDGFTARDVYKNHWAMLDKENTELACNELLEAGWLIKTEQETGGRPRVIFNINPKVLGENA